MGYRCWPMPLVLTGAGKERCSDMSEMIAWAKRVQARWMKVAGGRTVRDGWDVCPRCQGRGFHKKGACRTCRETGAVKAQPFVSGTQLKTLSHNELKAIHEAKRARPVPVPASHLVGSGAGHEMGEVDGAMVCLTCLEACFSMEQK